jgi:predicted unusual protein kinase regulating ubiquinone biosynthesis (AarF/ABC1/UbiB family)
VQLSIDASDVLPPEAMAILAQLQASAEPVEFESLRGVLGEDLGKDWEQAFDMQRERRREGGREGEGEGGRPAAVGVTVGRGRAFGAGEVNRLTPVAVDFVAPSRPRW